MRVSDDKADAYSKEPHDDTEVILMLPQERNQTEVEGRASQGDIERDKGNGSLGGTSPAAKEAFHLAGVAGNVACVKLLLERGVLGGVNEAVCGFHGEEGDKPWTPLCCAVASSRNLEVVQLLVDKGADVNLGSGLAKSSPLHVALTQQDNLDMVEFLLKAGANHSAKDVRGHTPLHVAAAMNDPEGVTLLLEAGADPSVVDDDGRTALHSAVALNPTDKREALLECVRLLLEDGRVDINGQDCYGYTALHLSAGNDSADSVAALLLRHGSDVALKTSSGTTALSMLVRKLPDVVSFLGRRLDSGVTLHDHDPADVNCEIKMDFRPLLPTSSSKGSFSKKKQSKMAGTSESTQNRTSSTRRKETELLTCLVATGNKKLLAHPLSETFLLLKWRRVRKFFLASLLFQMALVALFTVFVVEVYLIRCPYQRPDHGEDGSSTGPHSISRRSADLLSQGPHSQQFRERRAFNWLGLTPPKKKKVLSPDGYSDGVNSYNSASPVGPSIVQAFPPGHATVNHSFRSGGAHSRVPTTAFVPSFEKETEADVQEEILSTYDNIAEPITEPPTTTAAPVTPEPAPPPGCNLNVPLQGIWILLVVAITLMSLQELFQLVHTPTRYLLSSENWAQWLLIASVMITAYRRTAENGTHFQLEYWQYPAAACGILMAWSLILYQVGRFPSLGLYVEMLSKVATNFGLFILAYACLLIAFALSFCVLFPEHPPFSSVPLSILKVFTMMVGEVDYEDLFYSEERANDPILFPLTAHLLFGAFVLIMTIVLMNLLVGLAVSDIQGLQKGAKLDRLCRQTALINRFESFIFSKKLQTILPVRLIQLVQENSLLAPTPALVHHLPQNEKFLFHFRPNDPRDRSLPKDIKFAALGLVASSPSPSPTAPPIKKPLRKEQVLSDLRRSLSSVSHHRLRSHFLARTTPKGEDTSPPAYTSPPYPPPLPLTTPSKLAPPEEYQVLKTKLATMEQDIKTILEMMRILTSSRTQQLLEFGTNANCSNSNAPKC